MSLHHVVMLVALFSLSGCCMSGGTSGTAPIDDDPLLVTACTTDGDCRACPVGQCGCAPSSGVCPPSMVDCYADPCRERVPTCRAGQCVLVAAPPPTACTTDADCRPCGVAGCGCSATAIASCPPMPHPCAMDPCTDTTSTCHHGACVLAPADGPCEADDDCEIRDDDCGCDCSAALRRAPPTRACAGDGCGGRPRCADRAARCDPATHRCITAR